MGYSVYGIKRVDRLCHYSYTLSCQIIIGLYELIIMRDIFFSADHHHHMFLLLQVLQEVLGLMVEQFVLIADHEEFLNVLLHTDFSHLVFHVLGNEEIFFRFFG